MWTMKLAALATALGFVALPAPLSAQSLTPSGERVLSDPTYLPLHGRFEGETIYQYADSTETLGSSRDENSNVLSQRLEYGIIDDLTVFAQGDYGWSRETVNPISGSRHFLSSNGFSDPTFGVVWRALDQRRQKPVDLDFLVSYAPSVIRATSASRSQTGTATGGSDVLILRAALGWATRLLTIQGYFEDQRNGSAAVAEPVGYENIQSRWQPEVGVVAQRWLTQRVSVRVEGSYGFQATAEEFDTSSRVASVHGLGDSGVAGAGLYYLIIPNKLVGSFEYSHTFYGRIYVDYRADPARDMIGRRSADGLIAVMRYAF
jgi:hypothetical protein